MRKRQSYWPSDRSLFRDKGRRRLAAIWIVLALSIAAALMAAGFWQHTPP
ncbi:MAG TPA: hypothetical protein VKI18_09145 [Albitalea sp.]|nr:hypothetical protein [Albitalea sp.]